MTKSHAGQVIALPSRERIEQGSPGSGCPTFRSRTTPRRRSGTSTRSRSSLAGNVRAAAPRHRMHTVTAMGLCRTAGSARQPHVKMRSQVGRLNQHVAGLTHRTITPPCLPGNSETLQQTSLHALAHCKMYIPYHSSESLSHHDGLVLVPPPCAGVLRHLDLPKPQLPSAAFSPPQAVLVQAICPARQTTHSASIRDVEHPIDRARVIRLFPRLSVIVGFV